MKNFFWQAATAPGTTENIKENTTRPGKLYVAFLNNTRIDGSIKDENANYYQKASVFSTSSGGYYVNGIAVNLSQDEEASLYDEEMYEYY